MKHPLSLMCLLTIVTIQIHAQDLIVPKQGNPITAYNLEVSDNYYFYTTEASEDAAISRIAKDSVLVVRRADGSVLQSTSMETKKVLETSTEPEEISNYPEIKDEDIHGNIITKGNCVFIPTDSHHEAERAGQVQLKKRVKEWGYWTVVDKPEQAHFILQYWLNATGRDCSALVIRHRGYYMVEPIIQKNTKKGIIPVGYRISNDENPEINISNANILFNHLKSMLTDQDYQDNEVAVDWFFSIDIQRALDADRKYELKNFRDYMRPIE